MPRKNRGLFKTTTGSIAYRMHVLSNEPYIGLMPTPQNRLLPSLSTQQVEEKLEQVNHAIHLWRLKRAATAGLLHFFDPKGEEAHRRAIKRREHYKRTLRSRAKERNVPVAINLKVPKGVPGQTIPKPAQALLEVLPFGELKRLISVPDSRQAFSPERETEKTVREYSRYEFESYIKQYYHDLHEQGSITNLAKRAAWAAEAIRNPDIAQYRLAAQQAFAAAAW